MAKHKRKKTVARGDGSTPFGALLREAWESTGITQSQFAERLGVTQPRICEIFGQVSMTEQLLDRCVAALGMRLEVRITQ
jgi:plasmid maintenance system antidote protein VapI